MTLPEGTIADSIEADAEWLAEVSPTFYRTRSRVLQFMEDAELDFVALADGSKLCRVQWGEREPSLAQTWRLEVR